MISPFVCVFVCVITILSDLPKMESEGLLMGGNGFIKVASTTAVSQRHLGQPRPHVRTARFYFLKKLPEHVAVHIVIMLFLLKPCCLGPRADVLINVLTSAFFLTVITHQDRHRRCCAGHMSSVLCCNIGRLNNPIRRVLILERVDK